MTPEELAKAIDKLPLGSNERLRLQGELDAAFVPNIMMCPYCGGTVDRDGMVLQCRKCKALGDTVVGIMSPPCDP